MHKRAQKRQGRLFKEVSVWNPESYVPSPPPSVPVDGCLLASFSKGERKVLDALAQANVNRKLVPDVDRVWANFSTFQLYSPEEALTFEHVRPLLGSATFSGKGFFEMGKFISPCSPGSRPRIVKLGSTDSFQTLETRSLPISTLQQLRLVDQVVSLTNFHYKVQMREGVTDSFLVEALRSFNNNKGERQFHSVYDGVSTRLMHPPPTPRSRSPPRARVSPSSAPSAPLGQESEGFLVLEDPPFHLRLEDLKEVTDRLPGAFASRWVVGPSGSTCALISFSRRVFFVPPRFFTFDGVSYRLRFFPSLPTQFAPPLTTKVSLGQALLQICSAAPSVFPAEAAKSVLAVVSAYPPEVRVSLDGPPSSEVSLEIKIDVSPKGDEGDEEGDRVDEGDGEDRGVSGAEGEDGEVDGSESSSSEEEGEEVGREDGMEEGSLTMKGDGGSPEGGGGKGTGDQEDDGSSASSDRAVKEGKGGPSPLVSISNEEMDVAPDLTNSFKRKVRPVESPSTTGVSSPSAPPVQKKHEDRSLVSTVSS